MKKVFLTVVLVLAFTFNYSFAQMGGGMMGGQEGMKGQMQEMNEQKETMTLERTQTQKDMKEMNMDSKKGMEFLKAMAPSDIKYTSLKVEGKKATLSATGKMMDEPQYGSIDLEEEDGAWKVGQQSWTNKKP